MSQVKVIVLGTDEITLNALVARITAQNKVALQVFNVSRCEQVARRYGLLADVSPKELGVDKQTPSEVATKIYQAAYRRKVAQLVTKSVQQALCSEQETCQQIVYSLDDLEDKGADIISSLSSLVPDADKDIMKADFNYTPTASHCHQPVVSASA